MEEKTRDEKGGWKEGIREVEGEMNKRDKKKIRERHKKVRNAGI